MRTLGPLVVLAVAAAIESGASVQAQSIVAERVTKLTRGSAWKLVKTVPIGFATHHPQGMVKIGDALFVSSVEVKVRGQRLANAGRRSDRDPGAGIGHLFKLDTAGKLLASVTLGEGTMYHPGGLDYDGRHIWVAVAEYRPDSQSIVYRIDPGTLKATEVLRFQDHIGAIVHNTDDGTLHGVSWGSRRFYRWRLGRDGRVTNAAAPPATRRTLNASHYVDYQDCKYAGASRMLCTGLAEFRQRPDAAPFLLGGLDLVDLRDGRPVHQVPVPLWTAAGLDMTHNPVWIEPSAVGLRAYFMPEDDSSTLYVYEVETQEGA
jgi:Family of unknown function (DUF6454)